MDTRIGIIGIVVEDLSSTDQINKILHDHANLIVGRMGIPYKKKWRFSYFIDRRWKQ